VLIGEVLSECKTTQNSQKLEGLKTRCNQLKILRRQQFRAIIWHLKLTTICDTKSDERKADYKYLYYALPYTQPIITGFGMTFLK